MLGNVSTTNTPALDDFIAALKQPVAKAASVPADPGTAAQLGAPAVRPLVQLMADPDFETARRAKRALQSLARHAARPGAPKEAKAVAAELLAALNQGPVQVRRDLLWMLSEICDASAVPALSAWLTDAALREDARCALIRIPGPAAVAALKKALAAAPEEFKPALAQALRERGEPVKDFSDRHLRPAKGTTVSPKGAV